MPKSYLSEEKRQELLAGGLSQDAFYVVESQAADKAGDGDTAWAWLALAEIPAPALLAAKRVNGADWIRAKGLRTETAEAAYGKDWLNREI
ncbi:hypothetical protein ACSHT0_15375 [Tepidicaulis sp. LMO-SS28]|uniref:hypothetical protein n=1 Tax=Tepidicaulis sp. LMO-SS28 TaxID=3447455 RepID=UPI003EE20131